MQIKTLKNYFRVLMIAVTFSLFLVFYLFSSYLHTNLAINENQKISEALSKQVFNSMYQVMRQGWSREQLQEFINVTKSSFQGSSYSVDIFRGEKVENIFGKIEQSAISPDVQQVFDTKEKLFQQNSRSIKSIMPIIAKDECIVCHTNSKEGDILGAVRVDYSFEEIVNSTQKEYLLFSLIILPVMLLITYYISLRMLGRVNLSIENFKEKIESVNSVKEFKNIETSHVKDSFKEFEQIMIGLSTLSGKLKNIAVDKSILEFEVKLLDKMVITSEIIKDWKEYIKDLLHEIHIVLPVYCLITIFKTDDENYEIEIFWLGEPDQEIKDYLEETSINMIKEHHNLSVIDYTLRHNVSSETYSLGQLTIEDIEHEAKSILLDAPRIGGIVGLGIQSNTEKDSIHSIVIDSILTTLLNLVGSIKAINKYTENLEFYATRDPLTSLFSQRVFRDLLEYEVKRAARHKYKFGVLVIDCDNFKPINDTYGHSFGDDFLKAFASLLKDSKRDEDILSRYGGDEFTIILPESDEKEVYTVATRILGNVEKFEMEAPDGTGVGVTVSIGMAIYPDHSVEPKELFNIADNMMYQAKNLGKNAIKFPSEYDIEKIHQDIEDKSMIVLDAIKNEKIVPHFQPIMNTSTESIEINELLMRIEIENEILTAGRFIETAESLGIVHKMDYIVIEKAFKKIKETNYTGILFVNLSPKALIISEFIDKVVNLTNLYDINKEKIVFEITERETVKSFALLEKFVQNLKMEGFSFAIDDFGSGFSTFHYVKRFPIDYIKIDGDFIVNITKDKKDLAFVKSIVALAKELKVSTIAEFVEDEEILGFLKEIDVDYAQGYHIGKPSPELSVRK
ncbi:GGDEF-domain containing protein [Halarcobacter ebronensis]|uniref:GGDEF-domain containing protein n=1 Tax=Halarcobacter ebronensis TaxID=1462615 RepID=A0A4Q0Y9C9_9BACT|nr:bifunctional diguanylate cyclase/phosphodiesterase [Halarcobacter ebronensis]QKF81549.1 diguanylate cyclase/phosphodiesterase [Halarcobacter ebronensis]RXJ66495.1 GGDEF-domain containing protein [Halarcobacter ebronensis]RXK05477.1 GGDEF-domain containing protein [Halarcobacter ebronensis]